jgi:2-C-methyl-D-erythritol 4-phosphate cytidylyltransferase
VSTLKSSSSDVSPSPRLWAVVPAAGIGKRMGASLPKQYLPLGQRTIIAQTLTRLAAVARLDKIIVCIAQDDTHWEQLQIANHPLVEVAQGGAERCDSVLNGLDYLQADASADDWVLVHDVVRPCITAAMVDCLIDAVSDHPVGGLLAARVADTLKRGDSDNSVVETLDREQFWRAQTPQMFRFGLLRDALRKAARESIAVTDESAALENAGYAPRLVENSAENIKITRREDLALAEFIIAQQIKEGRAEC